MKAWIEKTGGDLKSIKWIQVPTADAAAAILDHKIAAAMLREPELSTQVHTGKVRVLSPVYGALGPKVATDESQRR